MHLKKAEWCELDDRRSKTGTDDPKELETVMLTAQTTATVGGLSLLNTISQKINVQKR